MGGGLAGFNPQELANTVWAYATAGVAADALFAAVAEVAVRSRLAGFNPQNLANTVWAFAKTGVAAEALYAAVAEAVVSGGMAGFNAQNLANTVWAYATAGVAAVALYAAVAEAAVRSWLAGFSPQNLANTVWAYATAGVAADALYAAVAEAAVGGGLAGFTPQNLANTVWAYATADHYHQALLADCSRVISDSLARDPSRWSIKSRHQLHQWQLWLSLKQGADGQHLLPDSQRQLCCDAMHDTQVTISGLQIAALGCSCSRRHQARLRERVSRAAHRLLARLGVPSSRIAIEVDGPSHFLRPDGQGVRAPNALQATTEVSAKEARANIRALNKNLEKQVQRRQWS